jgi:hypothetical protein
MGRAEVATPQEMEGVTGGGEYRNRQRQYLH